MGGLRAELLSAGHLYTSLCPRFRPARAAVSAEHEFNKLNFFFSLPCSHVYIECRDAVADDQIALNMAATASPP